MTTETIIERIQKLLRLAAEGSGATAAEAEAAAEAASRLMFQHSINEAQVQAHKIKTGDTSGFKQEFVSFTKSAAWERELMSWIAWTGNVHYFQGHRASKLGMWSCELIGQKDNVEAVVLTFKWLRDELNRMAREAYAREKPRNDLMSGFAHMDPFRFHVSFKRGAVSAIGTRLMAAQAAREKEARESGQGTALVLVGEIKDDALVHFKPWLRSWLDNKRNPKPVVKQEESAPVKARKIRMRKPKTIYVSETAYTAGRIAGQMVRLSGSKELDK